MYEEIQLKVSAPFSINLQNLRLNFPKNLNSIISDLIQICIRSLLLSYIKNF